MKGFFMHYSISSEKSFSFMSEAMEAALFLSQRSGKASPEDAVQGTENGSGNSYKERGIKVERRRSLMLLRPVCLSEG